MAIGDLFSNIFGGDAGKEEMQKSTGLSREALEELKRLYVPTVEEQQVILQNPELAPLLEAAQVDADPILSGVTIDPRLAQARARALDTMMGLGDTGLGAEDIAALRQIFSGAGATAQANNATALQRAAAQGTADSGSLMMAQLMSGQQAANRAQEQGMQQAAQAQANRRAAIEQAASLSNNMAQNDFANKAALATKRLDTASNNANARNIINQFNTQNIKDNLNNEASNANQQEIYNKQLIQQKFQNDMSKATGVAGQTNNLAGIYAQQGQNAAQGQAQLMGSLISGGSAIAAGGKKQIALKPEAVMGAAHRQMITTTIT